MVWKIRAACRLSRAVAGACCVGLVLSSVSTSALHFVMLDDPAFFRAEVDRVLAEAGARR